MSKEKYEAYLHSDHWKALKRSKLSAAKKGCIACARRNHLHLHHMIYRGSPENTKLSDLVWLCGRCHKLFHDHFGVTMKFGKKNGAEMLLKTRNAIRKLLTRSGETLPKVEGVDKSPSTFCWNTFPSPDEITSACTPGYGWTREQLEFWGIAWPPKKGWKKAMIKAWHEHHENEIALAKELERRRRDNSKSIRLSIEAEEKELRKQFENALAS